jgi:tetratricopeptide (TPR) repeat protein
MISHGGGLYGVNPALPWYFRGLFERYFGQNEALRARRAFVVAMGGLGDYYHNQYNQGNRQVLDALMAEEDNLLAAWRLARQNGWWDRVTSAMQGLRMLYGETGRGAAWQRLVEAVKPDLVDPNTDRPLPGREEQWSLFTEYRVLLVLAERNLGAAERLQRLRVDWDRERARDALATVSEQRNDVQRNAIRTLAASVHVLGQIQRENDDPSCAESYREALDLTQAIGDRAGQAVSAFNLGNAYMDVATLRDFDAAENWLRQSLDLFPPGDAGSRGNLLCQLGKLAILRFEEAMEKKQPEDQRLRLLNQAANHCQQALQLFPPTAIAARGVAHNMLGVISDRVGDIDGALHHYQQRIRYCEQAVDVFGAGQTRYNVAITLIQADRIDDARSYAEAALANVQTFGERAAKDIQHAERLLALIDQAEAQRRTPS